MYTLKDARIEIGTWLYLQVEPDNVSKAILIGVRPDKYIATTYPIPYLSKSTKDLTVYFHNGSKMYEFKTKVVRFFDDPIEFLLLEYPDHVSVREQRSYKRIRCLVSARVYYNVEGKSEPVEGIIKDVSKKGCRITFSMKKVEDEAFDKNERIMIACKFPGIPGEQKLTGIIRNIMKGENDISFGVEFDEFAWWAPPY